MKKKLIIATAILLLLAISMTLLVGCDEIFKRNDKRDMTQIVATVNYKGEFQQQTYNIYKFELASSFNSYAYYYTQYYGMSYEEACDYTLRSLAQQKLLVLFAKDKVTQLYNNKGKNFTAIPKIEELLSLAERNKAIEEANESLLSSLKRLVQDAVTEDKYNSGTTTDSSTDSDDEDEELGSDTVNVKFDSVGGSDVEKQTINKNSKAKEPTAPTKDGYTFYGWYTVEVDAVGDPVKEDGEYVYKDKFDFGSAVAQSVTLYAKWEKYLAPRTEIPEVEEDEDADYDPEVNEGIELAKQFFSDEYQSTVIDEFEDEDFKDDIIVPADSTLEAELKKYINDALGDLKRNLQNNLYKNSVEECYNYYLNNQYESLLVTRLERMLGEDVTVSDEEIEAEFQRVVAQNKEAFKDSDTAYSSALTSSLNSTYLHPDMAEDNSKSYGFVINILLRLDDESLEKLTDFYNDNHQDLKELVRIKRNKLLSEMMVNISNPFYKSTEELKGKDSNGDEVDLKDPMTDPNNPYGYFGAAEDAYDHSYQHEVSEGVYNNDYNNILSFVIDDETGKASIQFNVSEHPAMAYMLQKWPAFDNGEKVGIIHQIYNSFEAVNAAVKANKLSPIEGAYWLREVATKWAYLVGDDSGAVTSSSNNNGLGYLITPEGESSSYLEDFTDYARTLIKKGTTSYSDGTMGDKYFEGADAEGNFAGDKHVFVAADSFIDSGSTSNAYTGIFVLLNSYTVWDDSFYNTYTKTETNADGNRLDNTKGELPLDYVFSYVENKDDIKTLKDIIKDAILDAKREDIYSFTVNEMGIKELNNIVYHNKAYKSLWKDLD